MKNSIMLLVFIVGANVLFSQHLELFVNQWKDSNLIDLKLLNDSNNCELSIIKKEILVRSSEEGLRLRLIKFDSTIVTFASTIIEEINGEYSLFYIFNDQVKSGYRYRLKKNGRFSKRKASKKTKLYFDNLVDKTIHNNIIITFFDNGCIDTTFLCKKVILSDSEKYGAPAH